MPPHVNTQWDACIFCSSMFSVLCPTDVFYWRPKLIKTLQTVVLQNHITLIATWTGGISTEEHYCNIPKAETECL